MFPVFYKNNPYLEKDCDSIFLQFYECEEALNLDNMVYVSDGVWIAPNGDTIVD